MLVLNILQPHQNGPYQLLSILNVSQPPHQPSIYSGNFFECGIFCLQLKVEKTGFLNGAGFN